MTNFNPDQALVYLAQWIQQSLVAFPLLGLAVRILLSTLPLVVIFASCFALTTWLERKGMARIQNRIGPNRAGIPLTNIRLFGLGQPAADGIKMLMKEDIVPTASDAFAHFLAPVLIVIPPLLVLAFLPFGRNLISASVDTAVILFFALGSVSTLALFLAGWSSRNKYSLIGGMRAIAQMVSYELPLVLSAVPVIMVAGTLNTSQIVEQQRIQSWIIDPNPLLQIFGQILGWNIFTPWGLAGFLIFFISSLAETNRSPFDLPEADSEIIAGPFTEYSGFKYALFFLAEYISAFAISGLAVTLFLGGWSGPNFLLNRTNGTEAWLIPGFIWFFAKMFTLILLMIWIRGTLPRLRVDQLMNFAWKFLLPLALLNIFVAGFCYFTRWYLGWPVGIFLLAFAYVLLAKLDRQGTVAKRTYRYA